MFTVPNLFGAWHRIPFLEVFHCICNSIRHHWNVDNEMLPDEAYGSYSLPPSSSLWPCSSWPYVSPWPTSRSLYCSLWIFALSQHLFQMGSIILVVPMFILCKAWTWPQTRKTTCLHTYILCTFGRARHSHWTGMNGRIPCLANYGPVKRAFRRRYRGHQR